MRIFSQALAGGFLGKVIGATFVAFCAFFGFGPKKWAEFMITALPGYITPALAQWAFIALGGATLTALLWSPILGLWRRQSAIPILTSTLPNQSSKAPTDLTARPEAELFPYVDVRELANKKGWNLLDRGALASNRAYDLETAMRQAAASGQLHVYGRKYSVPLGTAPLLPVPKAHFEEYEFRHGCLNYDTIRNVDARTDRLGMRDAELVGKVYCDLHIVRPERSRCWIKLRQLVVN